MKYLKLTAVAAVAATFYASEPAVAQDRQLSEVFWVAANFCPRGSLPADGRLLQISSNNALFSLLGTNYGGDGRTTFGLPDLRGRSAAGVPQSGGGLGTMSDGGEEVVVPNNLRSIDPGKNTAVQGTATLTLSACIAVQGLYPSRP